MPDYVAYRKSISDELASIKNRVRDLVKHWAEDGRYKEIILRDTLIRHLPQTVSVGTGFVMCENEESSRQIDIIVYLNSYPPLFRKDDFVIVVKESVVGIIEVKTDIRNCDFEDVIQKAHRNGELIGDSIFNGIFAYKAGLSDNESSLPDNIKTSLVSHSGLVNNIVFGENIFAKYWTRGSCSRKSQNVAHYSFYNLRGLAFGYFISNLIQGAYERSTNPDMPETLKKALFPIEGGKNTDLIVGYEVDIEPPLV